MSTGPHQIIALCISSSRTDHEMSVRMCVDLFETARSYVLSIRQHCYKYFYSAQSGR